MKVYFDDIEIDESVLGLLPNNMAEEIKKQEAVCFGILTLDERELVAFSIFTQDVLDENTAVLEVIQASDELWENNVLIEFFKYCEGKLKEAGAHCIYYRYIGRSYENVRCGRFLTSLQGFQYVNNKSAQLTVGYDDLINSVLMNDACMKIADPSNIRVYRQVSGKAVTKYVTESRSEGFYMEIPPGENNRSLLYQRDGVIIAAVKARVIAPGTIYVEQGHQLNGYNERALVIELLSTVVRMGIREFDRDIRVIFEIENDAEYEAMTKVLANGKIDIVDEFVKAL